MSRKQFVYIFTRIPTTVCSMELVVCRNWSIWPSRRDSPAVAITDHGNLFGAVQFYNKAKTAGINGIIGCEVYIANDRRSRTEQDRYNQSYYYVRRRKDIATFATRLRGIPRRVLPQAAHRQGNPWRSTRRDSSACRPACAAKSTRRSWPIATTKRNGSPTNKQRHLRAQQLLPRDPRSRTPQEKEINLKLVRLSQETHSARRFERRALSRARRRAARKTRCSASRPTHAGRSEPAEVFHARVLYKVV